MTAKQLPVRQTSPIHQPAVTAGFAEKQPDAVVLQPPQCCLDCACAQCGCLWSYLHADQFPPADAGTAHLVDKAQSS